MVGFNPAATYDRSIAHYCGDMAADRRDVKGGIWGHTEKKGQICNCRGIERARVGFGEQSFKVD